METVVAETANEVHTPPWSQPKITPDAPAHLHPTSTQQAVIPSEAQRSRGTPEFVDAKTTTSNSPGAPLMTVPSSWVGAIAQSATAPPISPPVQKVVNPQNLTEIAKPLVNTGENHQKKFA
jgi:hypothetical protein